MTKRNKEHASFRDPSGYVYYENDNVYRKIDKSYFEQYNYTQKQKQLWYP